MLPANTREIQLPYGVNKGTPAFTIEEKQPQFPKPYIVMCFIFEFQQSTFQLNFGFHLFTLYPRIYIYLHPYVIFFFRYFCDIILMFIETFNTLFSSGNDPLYLNIEWIN